MVATRSQTRKEARKRKFIEISDAEDAGKQPQQQIVVATRNALPDFSPTSLSSQRVTLDALPTEMLYLIFDSREITFAQKKRLSLVCKRFYAISRSLLFRTLALSTDEEGKAHDWMVYLEQEGQHIAQIATQAVLHNWEMARFPPVLISKCRQLAVSGMSRMRRKGRPQLLRAYYHERYEKATEVRKTSLPFSRINPTQAFRVLARMPNLVKLSLDGFEDGLHELFPFRVELLDTLAVEPQWPVLTTVQTLTLSPDVRSYSFSDELHAMILRSCPNSHTLRINFRDLPYSSNCLFDQMPLAMAEASRLQHLKTLKLFRFGHFADNMIDFDDVESDEVEIEKCLDGWSPSDIEALHQYLPDITRLSVYGNLNADYPFLVPWEEDYDVWTYEICEFIPAFRAFDKLERLLMTDEVMMDGNDFRVWLESVDFLVHRKLPRR
ncbi:hypothetical protein QBC40DRAFT_295118 [Triangularia verruculosa]|uniref:F-box domain-containing protein n=1 Tax=Triangularia verruculosa TaxID=2587418 RepID=A0AAN7AXD7_9PEZI|nr:hypothetical protein QBC40DRAFT_295118 [Triangularia verruculosa]